MKKIFNNLIRLMLVTIMSIITYITACAEDSSDKVIYYKVALDADNSLNIREAPSGDATVVGKVPGNNKLNVISQTDDGEWYEVKYNKIHGYAKSEYIKRCERKANFGDNVSRIMSMSSYFVPKWSRPLKVWMTTALIILGFIITFAHKVLDKDSDVHIILTSILSISVIAYVLYMGNNALWFFNVSKIGGWFWFFIHIILFLNFVAMQVSSFYYTKSSIHVNMTLGVASTVGLFAGLIVCAFVGSKYVPWLFGAFVLSQIIQCVMIGRNENIWYALAYLAIVVATVMLLLPTLIIGIIVAICMFALVFLSPDDNDRRTPNYDEEPEYDIEIKGGGSFGGDVKAKTDIFGNAYDENGRKWKDNKDGTFSRND